MASNELAAILARRRALQGDKNTSESTPISSSSSTVSSSQSSNIVTPAPAPVVGVVKGSRKSTSSKIQQLQGSLGALQFG